MKSCKTLGISKTMLSLQSAVYEVTKQVKIVSSISQGSS